MFKVRNHSPCVLSDMKFDVDLPEEDEVQVNYCIHVMNICYSDTLGTEKSVLISEVS